MASNPDLASTGSPADIGLTVLTEDAALCDAITHAADDRAVHNATCGDEAELLAATDRCHVLVADLVSAPSLARLVRHIRTHQPSAITVAVGTREQEQALLALMANGIADHVMLKPVDVPLARNVLTSAHREYRTRQASLNAAPRPHAPPRAARRKSTTLTIVAKEDAPPATPAPAVAPAVVKADSEPARAKPAPPWTTIAVAAFLSAALASSAMWWFMWRQLPAVDPAVIVATNLDSARLALTEGRLTDPVGRSAVHFYSAVLAIDPQHREAQVGIERIATLVAQRASDAMGAGQLEAAKHEISRLRVIAPHDDRLARLEHGLQQELEAAAQRAAHVVAVPEKIEASPPEPRIRAERAAPQPVKAITPEPSPPKEQMPREETLLPTPVIEMPALTAIDPPVLAWADNLPAQPSAERKLVSYVAPEYPTSARIDGLEGWVDLDIRVEATGEVSMARVAKSTNRLVFGRPALKAVRQWRYEPREDGSLMNVRLTFRLED